MRSGKSSLAASLRGLVTGEAFQEKAKKRLEARTTPSSPFSLGVALRSAALRV